MAEAINLRERRLKHFKSTKLHIDEELYKEAKYHALKLVKEKKKQFYKEKLKENIGKPKELCKALKSLEDEDLVFKLSNDVNPDKAAGIDNLSGKFLKDGSSILPRPISKICNLSIKYSLFPTDCQIAKLKPLFKTAPLLILKIIVQYHYFL